VLEAGGGEYSLIESRSNLDRTYDARAEGLEQGSADLHQSGANDGELPRGKCRIAAFRMGIDGEVAGEYRVELTDQGRASASFNCIFALT